MFTSFFPWVHSFYVHQLFHVDNPIAAFQDMMQPRKHRDMPTVNNGIFEKFNTQDIYNLLKRNACNHV